MDEFFDWKWWLIRECNTIWDKASVDIKKEFDSEAVYNKIFWKYDDKVTDFYDKEIPKVDSNHTCLAVMNLDSTLTMEKMETIIHKDF